MPENSSRKEIVLGTVGGALLSIVLSITVLWTTSINAQIGLLITLVGTTLGAILGGSITFARRLDDLGETLREGSKLKALADMPDAEREIVELVTSLESVAARPENKKGFFWAASLLAIEDARAAVASVSSGVVNCTAEEEIQYVERALRFTTQRVDAIAARGPEWWAKPEADVYWTIYGRAAERLRIRRIFLVDGALNKEIQDMLDKHLAFNMETFWTPMMHVPVRLRNPIVLFDDTLLHRASSNWRLGAEHVDFTDTPREIEEGRAQFDAILALNATQKWLGRENY